MAWRAARPPLPDVLLDHTGVPTLAAICEAVRALEDLDLVGEVQLIVAGGIKSGVDAAKAIALGADAVAIGTAAIIALKLQCPDLSGGLRGAGDNGRARVTTATPAAARWASRLRTRS